MERSLSRSLPYLPRYQSLSPARAPCLGGRRFASLRSISSPSQRQRICYIDGGEATKLVTTSYRGHGSPSPRRSYKVHLFGPAYTSSGKRSVHHATRVTRSLSAHNLNASHVYTTQDDPLPGVARQAEARRACTSLQDLYHKGPFHPDATTASESGVSLGGLSDDSLSLCVGDDLDNLSQHSYGSSSAFHEMTFDSEHDHCDSSDAYFSGAEGGNVSGSHQSGDKLLEVLYEDNPDGRSSGARRRTKQSVPSPLSYGENRRRELQCPSPSLSDQDKAHAKLQTLRVLIPGTDVPLRSDVAVTGGKDRNKSPGEKRVLASTPLAQSTPHVSPRSQGETRLSILATWNADDSLEEHHAEARDGRPSHRLARTLFDADTSDARDGSSCNSSQSEDNFSDISSATVGSLTARRTKLVKRPSDKPVSSKTFVSLEHDQAERDPSSGVGNDYKITGFSRSAESTDRSRDGDRAYSPETLHDDSDNDEGGTGHQPSAASATWQDRQTYHEGNSRTAVIYWSLSEKDKDDDEGEEGDEEGEGEEDENREGQSKRPRSLSKTGRVRGFWHAPLSPTSGRAGDEANKGTEPPGKVSIPLISAGKHGQEKLRKRLSQSSPPPSPGELDQTASTLMSFDLKNNSVSDTSAEQSCHSGVKQEGTRDGPPNQALPQSTEQPHGLFLSPQSTETQGRAEELRREQGAEQDVNLDSVDFSDELQDRGRENNIEKLSRKTTGADGGGSDIGVDVDPHSDGPVTGHSYDRYAGPGEVTGIPAVTAGQFANNECKGEGRGAQPGTEIRDLREGEGEGHGRVCVYSSLAILPERGEDREEGGKHSESQVMLGAGERVGEKLGSRPTSPTLAPLTADHAELNRPSSWPVGRPSEQSDPSLEVTQVTGESCTSFPTTARDAGTHSSAGDSREIQTNGNNGRIESESDVLISGGSDKFTGKLKLTLTVALDQGGDKSLSRNVNRFEAEVKVNPTSSNDSFQSARDVIVTDVVRGGENEKTEEPVLFSNSSYAETNGDLCVIGEARSDRSMQSYYIDPAAIVASARAASEGETPQMLVRVVATAQNSTGSETVGQARHTDQPQSQPPVTTEFPSQRSQFTSEFPTSGYSDSNNINSSYSSVKGFPDSRFLTSSSVCSVELNNNNNNDNNNKFEGEPKRAGFIVLSEQEGNKRDQDLIGNSTEHVVSGASTQEPTSGRAHGENKGISSLDSLSGSGSEQTVCTGDARVVQKKEVVTEVCHTVVKKTHSTTVEDKNVSSEPNQFSTDRTSDTVSKTTIVEDVEDTVTTKTTTTTTTVDLDTVSSLDRGARQGLGVVNSTVNDAATTSSNVNCFDDGEGIRRKEQPSAPSPVGRDGWREKVEEEGVYQQQTPLAASDGSGLPVSHQPAVPSTHVMREVKPSWEARPDPGVTTWPASSPPSQEKPGGVNLYPVERHGDVDNSASRLDSLQATLAQISGLDQRNGAWSGDRDAVWGASHTHGSPSLPPSASPASPASPPYHDHAEATSVLKQIVRGDTDCFPNFSGPGRPSVPGSCDDYDTTPENSTQTPGVGNGPTYYSYNSVEGWEEPSRDNYTAPAQVKNGDASSEREFYDNDYDNTPSVTTALPSRHHHNHHHHHLQLLKPGQLKASSLWTLQEETESLLEAVSPKPTRRALTSLASDDEDNVSVSGEETSLERPVRDTDVQPSTEVGQSNLSASSIEQDLSDTAIGHKHCASESSDFDDSDGNYSSISTGESASYRSNREQTPLSDDVDGVPSTRRMDYRSSWRGHMASNVDGVSSFNDFVSGLRESLSTPYMVGNPAEKEKHNERVSTLDSLSESLRQFRAEPSSFGAERETFQGPDSSDHEQPSFHSVDNYHQLSHHQHHQPYHPPSDCHNSSVTSTSTLSQLSWATAPLEDAPSEASLRLHALDLDLSRISSCGSPAPSDLSEASSAYTCTGTAQIKRHHHHVSFGETPTAAALLSPPNRDSPYAIVPTSTPKAKPSPVSIIKRPPSPREQLRQKYVDDNVRQFDQLLKDFHKRTHPEESADGIQIMESQQSKVLSDKTSRENVSNYDDLYKAFTNEDTEKKQNNVCIVLEDENMNSYRFKRYLKKSHTKRKKGTKVMRFLNRLSCVSEGMSSPDLSPAHKKLKTESSKDGVQTFSTDSMPSPSSSPRLGFPNPQLTSSMSFQHHRQLEVPVGVPSSSTTPPQGSPASSIQSASSGRSRADSAYSSISESLSRGSLGSPGYPLTPNRESTSGGLHPRGFTASTADRSFSTDSAYSGSGRTGSELDRTLVDSSKDDSEDMLSALSDVFEQLDVCEGEIDRALLDRMRYGHARARVTRPTRRF